MNANLAATLLDQARQCAVEDVTALVADCVDGDPYELRLIARARAITASVAPTAREWEELREIVRLLIAYQGVEDPDHLEIQERHVAVRRSWDLPEARAIGVLRFDPARSRRVRRGEAA